MSILWVSKMNFHYNTHNWCFSYVFIWFLRDFLKNLGIDFAYIRIYPNLVKRFTGRKDYR